MGCRDGQIFCFDPYLVNNGRVIRYNVENDSIARKKKRVTQVKWFEPLNEGENCNKFLIVFEDGTIFVNFRDSKHNNETRTQKVKTADYGGQTDTKEYTRDQIVTMMQQEVGNFDFDKQYPKGTGDIRFYKQGT